MGIYCEKAFAFLTPIQYNESVKILTTGDCEP